MKLPRLYVDKSQMDFYPFETTVVVGVPGVFRSGQRKGKDFVYGFSGTDQKFQVFESNLKKLTRRVFNMEGIQRLQT